MDEARRKKTNLTNRTTSNALGQRRGGGKVAGPIAAYMLRQRRLASLLHSYEKKTIQKWHVVSLKEFLGVAKEIEG